MRPIAGIQIYPNLPAQNKTVGPAEHFLIATFIWLSQLNWLILLAILTR